MSELDIVIGYSKTIETMLERKYGAKGKGLTEKINSVSGAIPDEYIKIAKRVALIRNKCAHEDGYYLNDVQSFISDAEQFILLCNIGPYNNAYVEGSQWLPTPNKISDQEKKKGDSYKEERSHSGIARIIANLLLVATAIFLFVILFVFSYAVSGLAGSALFSVVCFCLFMRREKKRAHR